MFDDLRDPHPHQVTDVHIISVIARAHRIRRRQRIAMFTTSAALAVTIGGIAMVSRDRATTSIGDFASGASTEATQLPATLVATTIRLPEATEPLAGPAVEPTIVTVPEPGDTSPSDGGGPPAETVVTSLQVGATTVEYGAVSTIPASVPAAPSTSPVIAEPTTARPAHFVAVTTAGDLVLVSTATGDQRMLVPGTKPDLSSPSGQTALRMTAGGISPDGQFVYYAETVSGTVRSTSIANPVADDTVWGFGSNPKLSPDGSKWIGRNPDGSIAVHSKTESEAPLGTAPGTTIVDYVWYENDAVAILEYDGASWIVRVLDVNLVDAKKNPSTIDAPYVAAAGGPGGVDVHFVGAPIHGLLVLAQRKDHTTPDPVTNEAPVAARYFWVRPGPGHEEPWKPLSLSYRLITADAGGEWLLRLAADGTIVCDAVSGQKEERVPGEFLSVAW